MAAFNLDLRVDQGATYDKTVTWKTGDPALPVDLTGCSARMMARETVTATGTPLLSLTSGAGEIVLGDAAGTVQIILSAAVTAAITWQTAYYDLEIVFPDTTVRRLLKGRIVVAPEVTRP